MNALREKIERLFQRSASVDTNAQQNNEPNSQDILDLMQQQQEQQEYQRQEQEQGQQATGQIETEPRYCPELTPNPYTLGASANLASPKHISNMADDINYRSEFVEFINHHAPIGFSQKLTRMIPFMGVSLIAWPTYWVWRGYQWQTRRQSERIGMYIQRTFQQAKLMQIVILGIGLILASSATRSVEPIEIHEVSYDFKNKRN